MVGMSGRRKGEAKRGQVRFLGPKGDRFLTPQGNQRGRIYYLCRILDASPLIFVMRSLPMMRNLAAWLLNALGSAFAVALLGLASPTPIQEARKTFEADAVGVWAIAVSPDGKVLASG